MRLFVAVYPPPEALADLAEAVGRLRLGQAARAGGSVGLTARPRWHVTLAFLGESADPSAPVADALATGVSRWRAADNPLPRLRLAGGGRFGQGRFTVLWAGLDGDLDGLAALAEQVRGSLRDARVPYDARKPFRPHLTLARPGGRLPTADLAADLASLAAYAGPWWRVESVRLVRSRPGPHPEHQAITTVPLASGRNR